MEPIPSFDKEAFTDSTAPFEYVYKFSEDNFMMLGVLDKVSSIASSYGIKNFKTRFKAYCESQRKMANVIYSLNSTKFEGQILELDCGKWMCDESGITVYDRIGGEVVVCEHPIMPVERLVNIDTGIEKLKIGFSRGKKWKYTIVAKSDLGDPGSLAKLADVGISVNKKSAVYLSDYFKDIENLNYNSLPEKQSVSRLGWIDDEEGFSPYCGDLVFDGDANFKGLFDTVTTRGTMKEWLGMCQIVRTGSITSRIILAASFASCLVKPLGALPFFVHLWGGSETGKTTGLYLAASVWANPPLGKYTQTFNSTIVGKEMLAAFLNSLPLILDELQIQKTKGGYDEEIYRLAEGTGKTRSNQKLGVNKPTTWANCILTSGEMPITTTRSGGGAVNRILEIECRDALFIDAGLVAAHCKKHYGHAGKLFVNKLQEEGNINRAIELYKKFYNKLTLADTTEKQAMAAATIMVADHLATEWIFKDNQALTVPQVKDFLQTKAAVDINARGYEYMCGWVELNAQYFTGKSKSGDVWGKFLNYGKTVAIITPKFYSVAEEEGYNPHALLSYLQQKELIDTGTTKGFGKSVRLDSDRSPNCIVMDLPDEGFTEVVDNEPIPFV